MKLLTALICSALGVAPVAAASSASQPEGYVAHEWGTFTSVQGADGRQLDWNPHNVVDLPGFVYNQFRPGLGRVPAMSLTKSTAARQRMETPVIYFYAEQPTTVEVAVDFPEGTMTEWYPQARFADELLPAAQNPPQPKRNTLRWRNVSIVPRDQCGNSVGGLLDDRKPSHYYAARETDAALVKVSEPGHPSEQEKFLFYRGVAGFTAPLTVRIGDSDGTELILRNTGAEELRHLFAYEVRNGRTRWIKVDRLSPNEETTVKLTKEQSLADLRCELGKALRESLVHEGLYPREADAMIKTWDDSWFGETGTRVLYTLPRGWTDRTLPLRLAPSPSALERVMVGRAEMITPRIEQALASQVERFLSGDDAAKSIAIEKTRELALGRFGESTVRRVLSAAKRSKEFNAASWQLLAAAAHSPAAP